VNDIPMPDLIACPDPSCSAIAEIVDRVVVGSTSGPIEIVRTRCLHMHVFVLPADRLPLDLVRADHLVVLVVDDVAVPDVPSGDVEAGLDPGDLAR